MVRLARPAFVPRAARIIVATLALVGAVLQAVSPGLAERHGSDDAASAALWCGAHGPSATARRALRDLAQTLHDGRGAFEPQPAEPDGDRCGACLACVADLALGTPALRAASNVAKPGAALPTGSRHLAAPRAVGPPVGGRAPPAAFV